MATTRKYLNHLLQNTGITPACSEEERAAADDLAQIFTNHGFTPEVQEFDASATPRTVGAILGIVLFVGTVLMGVNGMVGVVGFLLAIVAAVLYLLERMGKISFSSIGASGLSQNVIAYHKASGPLASPRNRPVVIVAHYDSPRADLFSQMPYATYKPLIVKLMPYMMVIPAILAIVRLFPFPDAAKMMFWLIAIVAALVPLAHAVGVIANRFVLPYTTGSVCNKSSVASMLGVMDAVAPYQKGEEFPNDVPFEDYFSEQIRMAQEAENEAAAAAGGAPADAYPSSDVSVQGDVATTGVPDSDDVFESAAGATDFARDADATLAGTASMPAIGSTDAAAGAADAMGVASAATKAGLDETASMDAPMSSPLADGASDATATMPTLDEYVQGARQTAPAADNAAVVDERQFEDNPAQAVAGSSADATSSMSFYDDAAANGNAPHAAGSADMLRYVSEDEAEAAAGEVEQSEREGEETVVNYVNAGGNYRYGEDIIRAIGMIPESCILEYDLTEPAAPEPEPQIEIDTEPTSWVDEPYRQAIDDAETIQTESTFDATDSTTSMSPSDMDAYQDSYDEMSPDEDVGEANQSQGDETPLTYDEYDDSDAFGPYEPTRPVRSDTGNGTHTSPQVAEKLSSVGASAKRFFGNALRKGKSVFSSMATHHDEEETSEPQAYDDEERGQNTDQFDDGEDGGREESPASDAEQAKINNAIPVDSTVSVDLTGMAEKSDYQQEAANDTPQGTRNRNVADDTFAASAMPNHGAMDAVDTVPQPIEIPDTPPAADATQTYTVSEASATSQISFDDQDATVARTVSITTEPEGASVPEPVVASTDTAPSGDGVTEPHAADGVDATPTDAAVDDESSPEADARDVEAEEIEALMAEIKAPRRQTTPQTPQPQKRVFNTVPDPSQPSVNQMETASRSSLFDLPDPSTKPVDPFVVDSETASTPVSSTVSDEVAPSQDALGVISASDAPTVDAVQASNNVSETINPDIADAATPSSDGDQSQRGVSKLFHRKKQEESSMSDWLGVDEDFDAKSSGRDIGSWDNFERDDWKGGATGPEGTSVEELRDAVTSMGDDELLGHDVWFVATGASEFDNAGIQAFLDTHRDKLRGVFLINLESIGAGDLCMLATEGGEGGKRVLKGDKRIMNLVRRVSGAFHREFATVEMPYLTTDAYRAMSMSLRSLTIAGVEGNHLACSHSVDDVPYRVNEKNVRLVADVVTEVIRRS